MKVGGVIGEVGENNRRSAEATEKIRSIRKIEGKQKRVGMKMNEVIGKKSKHFLGEGDRTDPQKSTDRPVATPYKKSSSPNLIEKDAEEDIGEH